MKRRAIALSIAFASLFLAGLAYADEPLPLVPPTAIVAGTVPYPDDAKGDAVVVVELRVSDAGYVRDARVVVGDNPFADAALTAAYGWTFTPAHRGDAKVAARIRMRVEFHAPIVETTTVVTPRGEVKTTTKRASGVENVLVRGKRTEVGATRIGMGEVRQMPGAFGDAFRAIDTLPGVTPIVSGLPFFFVRGAPPGNTGYFIDGVRVPLLYHLAIGPSVVHPGLIESVEFYPGGYPARYGRYAGGVLDGQTTQPSKKLHAEANIRLFDAGLLVETPLFDDRLTVLAAARYSYAAGIVQLFARDTKLAYWDYQTRAVYKLGPKDRVSLFWFGSFDELDNRDRSTLTGSGLQGEQVGPFYPLFSTEFHRMDLRYDHDTSGGRVRLAATLGVEDSLGNQSPKLASQVNAKTFGLRVEGEERASSTLKVRYGSDVLFAHDTLEASGVGPDPNGLYPDRNDVTLSAWADGVYKPVARVEMIPGLRFDTFTSRLVSGLSRRANGGYTNAIARVGADPRLATRVTLNERATWITTFGVSHQPPALLPIPGLEIGRLTTGLQTSLQASQGVEVKLPLDFVGTATVFLHDYLGITDATATCLDLRGTSTANDLLTNTCLDQRVNGRAFGLEILLKRDFTKRVTGWLSYTLSRSTRETRGVFSFEDTFPKLEPMATIPSEADRTHVLNVIGSFDLGKGWRVGGRFVFYTGRPYSRSVTIQGTQLPVAPFNSERMPPFYRLDVRLEKRWRVFDKATIAVVLEGMNVTLTKEAVAMDCRPTLGSIQDTCTPTTIGPISVPSIGVEGSL